jgi:hypothetical protein
MKKTTIGGVDYATCKLCRKIYRSIIDTHACPDCITADEILLKRIIEFVRENPNNTVMQTAIALETTPKKILEFIAGGDIELTPGLESEKLVDCTRCGKTINVGVLCEECKLEFRKTLIFKEQSKTENKTEIKGSLMRSRRRD